MIDVVLVGAFVAYGLFVGLRARRAASIDLRSYFLAGRTLSSWRSGLSMTATQYAADTPLLAAGLVATGGVFALWRLWIYGIAFLVLGFLLASSWWRAGVVTDAELSELRYGGRAAAWLRGLKALYYGGIFNCAVLAMVLVAASRIAEPFLLWDQWLEPELFEPLVRLVRAVGVPLAVDPTASDVWPRTASNLLSIVLIYGFTVLYSTTGGLRSVVSTDLGQVLVLGVATGLYAYYAVEAVGGLGELPHALGRVVGTERASELLAFDFVTATGIGGSVLAVLGLQWLVQMNADGTGYLAQRCMACRSPAEARRAPVIFAFAQVLVRTLLWLPILIALLIVFPLEAGQTAAEREVTFVYGIQTLLPPGARGLMLVGMLAALASTLDTHINWGASYMTNDLYARVLCQGVLSRTPGRRELVWIGRLSGPLLMAISLGVMTQLESIQEAWHVTLLLGAGLGVPLLLRWLWRRANAWGELAAIAVSAVSAPVLLATVPEEALRLLTIAALSTAASVIASLVTRRESEERLADFYTTVWPPGFWGERASRKRLQRGLIAVLAASGSLFASLVGLGSWLVGGTAPAGLTPGVWIGLNLVVAAALVPLWLRALRGDR